MTRVAQKVSSVKPESFPALQELAALPHWVCWRWPQKAPINPRTGAGAQSDNPETWTSFQQAQQQAEVAGYDGVGVVFTADMDMTGIDFDDCIRPDGTTDPQVERLILSLDSFTYRTPSDQGWRVLVRGSVAEALVADKFVDRVEVYSSGRYFTVTPHHRAGTPGSIEPRKQALDALVREITARRRQVRKPNLALKRRIKELASEVEGNRSSLMASVAYYAGTLIEQYGLLADRIREALMKACVTNGLADEKGSDTLEREIDYQIGEGIKQKRRENEQATAAPAPGRDLAVYAPTLIPYSNGNGNGHTPHPEQDEQVQLTDEFLCTLDADDAGNGDALYALAGQHFLYCYNQGWLVYNGKYWKLDPDGALVRQEAVKALRQRRHAAVNMKREDIVAATRANESRINGCVSRLRTLVNVSIDVFDSDPDLLNCQNGVLNLRTGQLTPHSRRQHFTYCVPVAYRPNADAGEWLEYLVGVVGDGSLIEYLQQALGYSLTGHTREEVLFYLYGPTRSGKGTIAEVFMNLLPRPLSTTADFNTFTAKREGDTSNFDLAPLKPARLIFASESNRAQSLNPAKIKQLTGGDYVMCCFKHRDFFSYRPQFKVWMLSNWPVNGDPEDDALWGRVRVISFPNSYLNREDKEKKTHLKQPDVLEGVLAWAVVGAMAWYALGSRGLTAPAAVQQITQAQRDELDYVQQWLEACAEARADCWVSNERVMASYKEWCDANNVQFPKGPKGLAQSLKAKGFEVGSPRRLNEKVYRGVAGLSLIASGDHRAAAQEAE